MPCPTTDYNGARPPVTSQRDLATLEGKYEILRRLKGGGMGRIYLVRHRELDELRVVKVMRAEIAEDEQLRVRFAREAQLASRLRHPNIADVYDFATDAEGRAFLVMQFIDGVTFDSLIKAVPLPPLHLVVELCRQGLDAIEFLHRNGYVHRDIAPDNLMLTRDAYARPLTKLIDLGIAKALEGDLLRLTATGAFLGKLRYASPE